MTLDERRPGRAYERVQELLGEVRAAQKAFEADRPEDAPAPETPSVAAEIIAAHRDRIVELEEVLAAERATREAAVKALDQARGEASEAVTARMRAADVEQQNRQELETLRREAEDLALQRDRLVAERNAARETEATLRAQVEEAGESWTLLSSPAVTSATVELMRAQTALHAVLEVEPGGSSAATLMAKIARLGLPDGES